MQWLKKLVSKKPSEAITSKTATAMMMPSLFIAMTKEGGDTKNEMESILSITNESSIFSELSDAERLASSIKAMKRLEEGNPQKALEEVASTLTLRQKEIAISFTAQVISADGELEDRELQILQLCAGIFNIKPERLAEITKNEWSEDFLQESDIDIDAGTAAIMPSLQVIGWMKGNHEKRIHKLHDLISLNSILAEASPFQKTNMFNNAANKIDSSENAELSQYFCQNLNEKQQDEAIKMALEISNTDQENSEVAGDFAIRITAKVLNYDDKKMNKLRVNKI